jgi:hypothetical protein
MSSLDNVLIQCASIKFFAALSTINPTCLKEIAADSNLISSLVQTLNSDSQEVVQTALILIGNFGTTADGIDLLQLPESAPFKQSLIDHLVRGTSSTKLLACQSLSSIFRYAPDSRKEFLEQLWLEIGGIKKILDLAKAPFEELRNACFAIFEGLSRFDWGLYAIGSSGETIDFLLSRADVTSQAKVNNSFNFLQHSFNTCLPGMEILNSESYYLKSISLRHV